MLAQTEWCKSTRWSLLTILNRKVVFSFSKFTVGVSAPPNF
nr:MAG TPA: hypothetical protein [Caudoviricetes sp.]